ncbi:hypothetical protein B0H67DRAFT_319878 [Lasiosphaeris hirsuta]|uniref:Uncharacterized protein n=1 Tax=Lasiosphaeris hirsuta TaxID=260670 RepID=A0AA40A1T9_9PEZI|nr:hypothetical protein B0H67DRAFT_319878 [Lasiosphaeris hirsuta]
MTPTVEEITALFSQTRASSQNADEFPDEQSWQTAQLKTVLDMAQQSWLDGSHESLALIAEKTADEARNPSWRLPIGESGLLDWVLASVITAQGLSLLLEKQLLRLVGNACAECDENKARVVESGKLRTAILNLLDDDDTLLPFALSVIYNICVENEQAQSQICQAGLSKKLVDIVSGPRLAKCQTSLSIIIQMLEQLVSQDAEPKIASLSTPALLLGLATSPTQDLELEDFTGLCTVALAYLTYEPFQVALLETDSFGVLYQAVYDSQSRFDIDDADADVVEQLKQVWNAAVTILADISALPLFATTYPLGSPVAEKLAAWLNTPASHTHLQTAACLALGNLGRSDEASLALANVVRDPLISILTRAVPTPASSQDLSRRPPPQLLHAVLSFLKNLAIPAANKPSLGSTLLSPPQSALLPRLWLATTAQPQIQFAAVSLTRLLLVNQIDAIRNICTPLPLSASAKDGELLGYTTRSDGAAQSPLHILMDVAFRADTDPTKMEAARALCAVIRVLHSPSENTILPASWYWDTETENTADTTAPTRARFYAAHATPIAKTLETLLAHKKFATLRSEALFVLALMGRSVDSGRIAVRVLEPVETCRRLAEAVSGREVTDDEVAVGGTVTEIEEDEVEEENKDEEAESAPAVDTGLLDGLGLEPQPADVKQTAGMARIDRENGLVLVVEILRSFSDDLPPSRKKLFERILSDGSELILNERKQSK